MVHFRPEYLVHFTPVQVVHIAPESLVHIAPVEVVHYTPVCSVTCRMNRFPNEEGHREKKRQQERVMAKHEEEQLFAHILYFL